MSDQLSRNRLLAGLPAEDLELLRPHFRYAKVVRGQELVAPGAPIRELYFPFVGMISLIETLPTGHSVEVGTVTRESVVGVPVYPGARNLPVHVTGQLASEGVAIDVDRFWEAHLRSPAVRLMTSRATHALLSVMAQAAACNGAHEVGQRLAKWLLISRDAAESDAFDLTHELLAVMIGAQRPTITLAARRLQEARIIDYRRGHIRILDGDRLLGESCECYGIVRMEIARLMQVDGAPAAQRTGAEVAAL